MWARRRYTENVDISVLRGRLWNIHKIEEENLAKIEKEQKCRKNVEKNVDIYIGEF